MVVKTPDYEKRLTEYETGMAELQSQLKAMEEEVVTLRRRLQDAPEAGTNTGRATSGHQGPAGPGGEPKRKADLHPS